MNQIISSPELIVEIPRFIKKKKVHNEKILTPSKTTIYIYSDKNCLYKINLRKYNDKNVKNLYQEFIRLERFTTNVFFITYFEYCTFREYKFENTSIRVLYSLVLHSTVKAA